MDLVSWLVVWIKICGLGMILVGWGYLALALIDLPRFEKLKLAHSVGVFELGIVGLCPVFIFAVTVSLFTAVGAGAHWIFCLTGVGGCGWMMRSHFASSRPSRATCIWIFLTTLFVSYGVTYAPWNYDAGLYHLQAVSYFHQGALPFGIANVHSRLGSNTCWFPLSALSDGPVFGRDGAFLLGPAATLLFLGAYLTPVFRGWRPRSIPSSAAYAVACLVLLLASGVLFDWFALSPSPDLPAALSCIYAFLAFLRFMECLHREGETAPVDLSSAFLLLVSSAALAAASKLSQFPVLLLVLIAVVSLHRKKMPWRNLRFSALLGLGVLGAWTVQGLMTSGCFAFPLVSTCISSLPWAVDPHKATLIGEWIRAWARIPGVPIDQIPSGLGWVPIWWSRMWKSRDFAFILAWVAIALQALACLLAVLAWRARSKETQKPDAGQTRGLGIALLVALAGLLFWFFGAPDPRFGLGFLVAAPSLTFGFALAWAFHRDAIGLVQRGPTPVMAALIVIAGAGGCYRLFSNEVLRYTWRNQPEPAVRHLVLASGFSVSVPANGNQCWTVATPCTPEPVVSLHRASSLGHTIYFHSVRFSASNANRSDKAARGDRPPTKVGIFRSGLWQLDTSGTAQWSQLTTRSSSFGSKGGIPVVGDWTGSGTTKVGTWQDGFWELDLGESGPPGSTKVVRGRLGLPGDLPIVGDWDGSGKTRVGVWRNGTWYLDTSGAVEWNPATTLQIAFGQPGDIPVVGDWDGSGSSKIGVFRRGVWILNLTAVAHFNWAKNLEGSLGLAGDTPVVGDWDGSGKTKVGVWRNGTWYLDTTGSIQWNPHTTKVVTLGQPGDTPVVGDWTGSGHTGIGIWHSGGWTLNLSAATNFDAGSTLQGLFGLPGDLPVVGRW